MLGNGVAGLKPIARARVARVAVKAMAADKVTLRHRQAVVSCAWQLLDFPLTRMRDRCLNRPR